MACLEDRAALLLQTLLSVSARDACWVCPPGLDPAADTARHWGAPWGHAAGTDPGDPAQPVSNPIQLGVRLLHRCKSGVRGSVCCPRIFVLGAIRNSSTQLTRRVLGLARQKEGAVLGLPALAWLPFRAGLCQARAVVPSAAPSAPVFLLRGRGSRAAARTAGAEGAQHPPFSFHV